MQTPRENTSPRLDSVDALERIEAVLRLTRSAVWEVDRRGVYTYASASHEALLGYRPEELVGIRTIHDFYPREVPAGLQRALFEDWIGAGEEFTDPELPLLAKSGEIVWVTSHGEPLFGAGGEVVGFRGADTDISARMRAVEEARAAEAEIYCILDNLPFPVAVSLIGPDGSWRNPENKLFFLNRRHVETFGFTREDCPTPGEYMLRAYPNANTRRRIQSYWDRELSRAVREGGMPVPLESKMTTKSGEIRDVEISATVFGDKMVTCFQDLTERNRDRARLAESEELLSSLVESVPVPIAFTQPGDERVRMNRAFSEAYGWTARDAPTVEIWLQKAYPGEGYRSEVLARWEPAVERARRMDGRVPPEEYRMTSKDGSLHDVEISAVIFGDAIFGTFMDQTERKRVLRELEESETSLRGLVENAPLGIVRMQIDSGRLWMNGAFTKTLGYTVEDLPDFDHWLERAYPDPVARRRILEDWRRALKTAQAGDGRIEPAEVRVTGKDGREHEMQFSGIVVGGEVFGLWTDLTERNRAERLSRERQEQLARVGRVSTLGQLAASLAHELEQPLGAILNNAETASLLLRRDAPDPGELRSIMDDILADDRRAGAVLDRIRGMVRKRKFDPEAVAVESLLREVERLIRPLAAPRGIVVEISCKPGMPAIQGDPVLLQQALLNLGLNSVEAIGPRRDGRIEIHANEPEPGVVGIRWSDNGGGVPDAEFSLLFEPFHTTKSDGLGMGLPLVQSIVDEHEGRMRLENQPGRGLAVCLRFPARRP